MKKEEKMSSKPCRLSHIVHAACTLGAVVVVPAQATSQAIRIVPLPSYNNPTGQRNFLPLDLARVDVPVNGNVRFVYTTEGLLQEVVGQTYEDVFPGHLRYADIGMPIPDLASTAPSYTIPNPVSNWNATLGGDVLPPHGKGVSLQGIASVNGVLFVSVQIRKDSVNVTPPCFPEEHAAESHHTLWNGFAMLDGTAPPEQAFDPLNPSNPKGKELWSAGSAGIGAGLQEAVPEVVEIARTAHGRYSMVANYCGKDAAGKLLVLNITSLVSVDPADRILVDLYWLLGQYTDALPQYACGPAWPLGSEVPSSWFTMDPALEGTPGYDVSGNKLRPICIVKVSTGWGPNSDRVLLILGLNLDPVEPGSNPPSPLDLGDDCYPTLDDGNYDYLAIVDITKMYPVLPAPLGYWYFRDATEWANRTRFLRLPPDVPFGWDCSQDPPANDSGHDWSMAIVPQPNVPLEESGSSRQERIVGSGTPTSIVSDPDGKYLYVMSVDQGEGLWPGQRYLHDGGWHVPHLYVIDLSKFDVADQATVDAYAWTTPNTANGIGLYRFNKTIRAVIQPEPQVFGAWNVNATVPGAGSGGCGPTLANFAPDATIGPVYRGEYQLSPYAWPRMVVVRHPTGALSDRLYIGTNGFWQTTSTNAAVWPDIGALMVLDLSDPASPTYLKTITLPQLPSLSFRVGGLSILPSTRDYVGTFTNRYVFAVLHRDQRELPNETEISRLLIGQDGP